MESLLERRRIMRRMLLIAICTGAALRARSASGGLGCCQAQSWSLGRPRYSQNGRFVQKSDSTTKLARSNEILRRSISKIMPTSVKRQVFRSKASRTCSGIY